MSYVVNLNDASVILDGLIAFEKKVYPADTHFSILKRKWVEIEPEQYRIILYYDPKSSMGKRFERGKFIIYCPTEQAMNARYMELFTAWTMARTEEEKPEEEPAAA